MNPPNIYTPQFIGLAIEMRLCATSGLPGLTPKGTPMPQTPEEWKYLGDLYEKGMLDAQAENSMLRIKLNSQAQRLEKQRRTITGMFETPDEY